MATKEEVIQQQILTAAKHLFQVHGLAKVTMDDVAKAIGKGRSSLYYYYKSKDEIFEAVFLLEVREMLAAMTRAVEQATGTEQKLHAFFLTKLKVLREKRGFFQMLDAGMDATAFADLKKTKAVHHQLIMRQESRLLEHLLTEGMSQGELRQLPASELEILLLVLLSSIRGLRRELDLEANEAKMASAADMFIRMALHGLAR
ncbi:TetR/AcrR family transcriptional regulator [Hymenobacter sp. BRD67]|uniref:TetR/AcrR family transcriptional regulator n=1 Tax=Hymenobacter sp. BRD67 TaxID=2675877 RepID=UPI0015641EBA|nr:TetR/AcrR family transcriptional regulator [Hymenobacter sp. BRD67]QKG52991.1 TetR/AcrR family transcriptional regulator [Hymenobacter sp. BRD67]